MANGILDNWFGIDPNGGGIFDPNTGLLGGGAGYQVSDLGNLDVTAPGISTSTSSNPYADVTAPLIKPTVEAAQGIYNQGVTPLTSLQQQAFDQTTPIAQQQANLAQQQAAGYSGIAAGTDPVTQKLAQQAANASGAGFANAGTFGSARHANAANRAAADTIAKRQLQGLQGLSTAQNSLQRPITLQQTQGEKLRDFQANEPWRHLGQFQDAIGFGQNVPTTSSTVTSPSGADILEASVAKNAATQAAAANANPLGGVQQTVDQVGNAINTVGNTINTIGNVADTATSIWDTVSGWFAEGGEIPAGGQMKVSPRYQRAKMRKMNKGGM